MIAILLSLFSVMLGVGIISPLLPVIAENLQATGIWIGLIFASFSISRVLSLPFFGYLGDKFSRKKIFSTGLVLYTIIAILYAFSRTKEELLLVRILHGTSSAMVIPIAMAQVASISNKNELGKNLGIVNSSIFLGMAFGPLIGGVFADKFGYSSAFFAMSAFSAFSFLIALLKFPEGNRAKRKEEKRIMITKSVFTAIIYRILSSMGRGSVMSFLPIYLSAIGMSLTQIGTALFANLISSSLIQMRSGILADKYGFVKPVWFGSFIGAVSLFLIVRAENYFEVLLLSTLLGVSTAITLPAVSSLVAHEGVRQSLEGSYMGVLSASKSIGRAIGPILSGIIYDLAGGGVVGVRIIFEVAALLTILAALIYRKGVELDEVI